MAVNNYTPTFTMNDLVNQSIINTMLKEIDLSVESMNNLILKDEINSQYLPEWIRHYLEAILRGQPDSISESDDDYKIVSNFIKTSLSKFSDNKIIRIQELEKNDRDYLVMLLNRRFDFLVKTLGAVYIKEDSYQMRVYKAERVLIEKLKEFLKVE